MEEFLPILLRCPLFAGVAPEELAAMLFCMSPRIVACGKGEYLFSEGDPARQMGVMLSGSAQIIQEDYHGDRSIVGDLQPGQLFGETFALAQVPALPVSVVCTEPGRVMLLDCRRIVTTCSTACSHHQRIITNLLQATAQKNLHLHRKLTILSRRTTREKLMAYLSDQARMHRSREFTVPFNRQALADYLGVERSALSAEIGKLRDLGVLESTKSHFKLL